MCRASARRRRGWLVATIASVALATTAAAADSWTFWRGPSWDGRSDASGLVSRWSPEGENLLWKVEFVGRSTPVVIDGRVCAIGRYGAPDTLEQLERVACFDAESGVPLWDHRYPVYHTTVAFNRVGWASLAADEETGYVYAHGAAGPLTAYDSEGNIVWSHFTYEWIGRASGYGGRTQSPLVFGDMLIIGFVNQSWGDQAAPRHRYFAFDKRSGELLWSSTPGEMVKDRNTQGCPIVATIGGRAMLVSGNADGWVYALDVHTGEPIWKFHLSKRGINVTPVVADDTVYISHSEENLDTPDMGRVVAIDGTGSGDVTKTHEKWRVNGLQAGFPSPAYHDGTLFVVDNSANLHAFEAATGKRRWVHNVGTVGKASPVIADGKIFIADVNGRFRILKLVEQGVQPLDQDELRVPDGRYAEIYASAAVTDGRVYLAAESGLYAIGDKSYRPKPKKSKARPTRKKKVGKHPTIAVQVVPAELAIRPSEGAQFRIRAIDARGNEVAAPQGAWGLDGLKGKLDAGRFVPDAGAPLQAGAVTFKAGELAARARVRVVQDLPWSDDFETYAVDSVPATWVSARGNYKIADLEGNKVLMQPPPGRGVQRRSALFGLSDWRDYTIQVDFLGTPYKRRRPDIGVLANGYTLDLQGIKQQLEIRSWAAELRMAQQVPLAWEMDTWYTMKMQVEHRGGKALIHGKVWKRGEPEPEAWTLTVEDPFPVQTGCAGVIAYAPAPVYYDNLKIWKDEE